MSLKVSKMSSKCLKNIFKMSSKCLKNIFKMSLKCLQNVFKTSSKCLKIYSKCLKNESLDTLTLLTMDYQHGFELCLEN